MKNSPDHLSSATRGIVTPSSAALGAALGAATGAAFHMAPGLATHNRVRVASGRSPRSTRSRLLRQLDPDADVLPAPADVVRPMATLMARDVAMLTSLRQNRYLNVDQQPSSSRQPGAWRHDPRIRSIYDKGLRTRTRPVSLTNQSAATVTGRPPTPAPSAAAGEGAGVIARSGCVDLLTLPTRSNLYRLSCTIGSSKHEQPS